MKHVLLLITVFVVSVWGCGVQQDHWEKSPGVDISVEKLYDNGKPYLTIFYENFGRDTIRRIRYQLISITNGHADTVVNEIDPEVLLRPKDRHVVPRAIGQDTLSADQVRVGEIWVVKEKG